MLYLNTKFPKKSHAASPESERQLNTDRLKAVMEKLIINEAPAPAQPAKKIGAAVPLRPASNAWSYSERKRAAKTFKL
jgi:hypothetical protein